MPAEGRPFRDPGRASYQVAVTLCESCGRGFQEANGERIEVEPAVIEMAHCDAQHIGFIAPGWTPSTQQEGGTPTPQQEGWTPSPQQEGLGNRLADRGEPPPVLAGERGQLRVIAGAPDLGGIPGSPAVPDPLPMADAASSVMPVTHVGPLDPGSPLRAEASPTLDSDAAQIAHDTQVDHHKRHATQTVPPARRREVLRRQAQRCAVPGCRHATWVDLHHILPRSHGGQHDLHNLVAVCTNHHRTIHGGRLVVTGSIATGLCFWHADGSPYGSAPSARHLESVEQVRRGLRNLGFKEHEARRAVESALSDFNAVGARPSTEELLRAALGRLGPRAPTVPSRRAASI